MKWREAPIPEEYLEGLEDQMETSQVQVPVKYKHCHGDVVKQRKATKVHNYLRRHFAAMLNRPSKVSKLKLLAEKIKSLFKKE
jgi:hypothetical protein